MWLLWDLRAPSIRPAHHKENTPTLTRTQAHMHTDPHVYSGQAGVHLHIHLPTVTYTRAHVGIHVQVKEEVQKSNLKSKIQEFPDKLFKSDLRKNLTMVLSVLLPPLCFHPFLRCTSQYVAWWPLLELEKFRHLPSETTFPETQLKNVYWN